MPTVTEYQERKAAKQTDKAIAAEWDISAVTLKKLKKEWGVPLRAPKQTDFAEGATLPDKPTTELRFLADMYMQAQKMRVASENRARAVEQGADEAEQGQYAFLSGLGPRFKGIEDMVFKRMSGSVQDHPAWPWLSRVRGIGPTLATKLLGIVTDIECHKTMSSLWRMAGLAVKDGHAERRVKGEKLKYSPRLKVTMFLIGDSFIKLNSPFKRHYDDAKKLYKERRFRIDPLIKGLESCAKTHTLDSPLAASHWNKLQHELHVMGEFEYERPMTKEALDVLKKRCLWNDFRIHLAAKRKMEKVFLGCLYIYWREAEGLLTRDPYAIEKYGHTEVYRPEDYV